MDKNKVNFEKRIANLSPERMAEVIQSAKDDAAILSKLSPEQLALLKSIFEEDEE